MAYIIDLKTFSDNRGNLTVLEDNILPFSIKRVFYIYGVDDSIRGKHRHHKTIQALISLQGECTVYNNDGQGKIEEFVLNSPSKCLILKPDDWHKMYNFTPNCILQVFASEYFNPNDYIFEEYK